jgi:choline dehydrogenase-like flavoprotein
MEIRARKQVILCSGAIQTPRVLFQSGIGPPDRLEQAGIECRHPHERVGVGLQDHLVYPLVYRLREGQAFSWPFGPVDRLRYVENGQGPKSSNLAELGAFFDPANSGVYAIQWHVTPTHYLAYPNVPVGYPCISVGVTQCKPRSVGVVVPVAAERSMAGESGQIAVQIDPGYLSDPWDWDAYLQAIQWSREFFERSDWNAWIEEEIAPGPKRIGFDSLGHHVSRFATTLYHYSGSCSMGRDPEYPVDPRFKLRGIDGLRVCDASVFPRILGCNPQTTIMMLAMRLGDWLVEES